MPHSSGRWTGLQRLPSAIIAIALMVLSGAAEPDAPPAASTADAQAIIAKLGLEESPEPVRQRKGWAPPKTVLVANNDPKLLPMLQAVALGLRLLAAADADEAAELAPQADAVLGFSPRGPRRPAGDSLGPGYSAGSSGASRCPRSATATSCSATCSA